MHPPYNAGGQLSDAPIAALENQDARTGVLGTVGTSTLNAVQLVGRAPFTTSATSEGGNMAIEASVSILDNTKSK